MPSLVRVTNLENGRSANVKVNDRGPYARDRIIDLSSGAAELLGIKEKGSARVRVDILPDESRNLKELAMQNLNSDIYGPDTSYGSAAAPEPSAPSFAPTPEPMPLIASAPEPQPAAPTYGNGDYYVQVAAYSTYERAETLKNKIQHIGTVKIFKAQQNGMTLYKVRLGEFATREEADRVRSSVTDNGISGSRVIMKGEDGGIKWLPL
jgi:rare lipoprotein A